MTHRSAPATLLTLALLYGAGLGAAMQFAKLSVPFAALGAVYPDSGVWLGLVVSVISGLGIVFGFFAGLLVARLGYRRLLLGSLMLGAVLSAVQVALPPLPVMLALRLIEGMSHLVIVVAVPTLMAEIAPVRWRSTVLTVWSTFFGVAFALTAWVGLPLVALHGLGALLAIHAGWMALMAVALWPVLPKISGAVQPLPRPREIAAAHVSAYRSPRRAPPALGWLFYTLTYVSLLTVLPAQLSPGDRVWAVTLMPLAGLAVSLTAGVVLMRLFSAVQVVTAGFCIATLVAAFLASDPQNAVIVVGLMAVLGLVQAGSFAAVPQLNETTEGRAEANGALAQMGNLGNGTGTPILLGVMALGGVPAIYLFLVAAYGAGAGVHLWQARRRARSGGSDRAAG